MFVKKYRQEFSAMLVYSKNTPAEKLWLLRPTSDVINYIG